MNPLNKIKKVLTSIEIICITSSATSASGDSDVGTKRFVYGTVTTPKKVNLFFLPLLML